MDGVSESKSTTNSLDVYTSRFKDCRTVYPHVIVRPLGKAKRDFDRHFSEFLDDLNENECFITALIGDNPIRARARCSLCHSALYPCEYCFSKGTRFKNCDPAVQDKIKNMLRQKRRIEEQIEEKRNNKEENEEEINLLQSIREHLIASLRDISNNKGHIVWPSSSMNGEIRTKENILRIVQLLQDKQVLSKDLARGICGRSPLLDLDYFHFVLDIPCEYLHSMCLGNTKRMLELTFDIGENRPRATNRKLSPSSLFNELIRCIKVVREFSRRIRNLDFSVMKGQEFRNIALFFFPIIIECIESPAEERKLWLLFSFVLRACTIPNAEFQMLNPEQIKETARQFYKLYEKLFTAKNCTYNTHIFGSHVMDVRVNGPLTLTSAFGFEIFYSELRNSFTPGTNSTLKQIMQKVFIKRQLEFHSCKPFISLTNYETPMECNNLVYTFIHKKYRFFKILDIEDDLLICKEIEIEEPDFEETPNLRWELVGVYIEKGESEATHNIQKKFVAGKLIRVRDYLLTCPMNVLEEK